MCLTQSTEGLKALRFPREKGILLQEGNIEILQSFQPAGLPYKFQTQ